MKAYMFSAENGLYEGETFVAADMVEYGEGITMLAPPHETGPVPVFGAGRRQWALMPVSPLREHLGGKGEQP